MVTSILPYDVMTSYRAPPQPQRGLLVSAIMTLSQHSCTTSSSAGFPRFVHSPSWPALLHHLLLSRVSSIRPFALVALTLVPTSRQLRSLVSAIRRRRHLSYTILTTPAIPPFCLSPLFFLLLYIIPPITLTPFLYFPSALLPVLLPLTLLPLP